MIRYLKVHLIILNSVFFQLFKVLIIKVVYSVLYRNDSLSYYFCKIRDKKCLAKKLI